MSLTPERTAELQELCRQYRIDVLTAIHGAQSGHPGGSLSVCEILTLLYQQRMHVDAAHPDDPDRDRLVLCKGHAAPMLYRNLIGKGFLPPESMNTLRQTGSPLQGHPCMRTPGVDMPSGPLGIGLAAAQGMALGLKLNHSDARVYAVLGDGELDEGAVWEAAASAVKFGLDNLTAIVDWNKVQLDGTTDEIMPLRDLPGKWILFEPCDSEQVVFEEKVFGGSVPKNFFPAVEKGVRLAAEKGVLAGYPVVGLKATLLDGSYHPVDSSEMAFIMAAKLAYKAAMPEAGPVILEPIHTLKAHVPNDNTGDIMGDVTKRRGRVLGMEPDEDGLQTIIAEVPLAELANFTTFIRQTTQGRGWFTTEFARYEILPEMLVPAVVEQARKLGNLDESADD